MTAVQMFRTRTETAFADKDDRCPKEPEDKDNFEDQRWLPRIQTMTPTVFRTSLMIVR